MALSYHGAFIQDIISSPGTSLTTPALPYQPIPDREEHPCTAFPVVSDPFGLGTQSQVWVECLTLSVRRDTGLNACNLQSH